MTRGNGCRTKRTLSMIESLNDLSVKWVTFRVFGYSTGLHRGRKLKVSVRLELGHLKNFVEAIHTVLTHSFLPGLLSSDI